MNKDPNNPGNRPDGPDAQRGWQVVTDPPPADQNVVAFTHSSIEHCLEKLPGWKSGDPNKIEVNILEKKLRINGYELPGILEDDSFESILHFDRQFRGFDDEFDDVATPIQQGVT